MLRINLAIAPLAVGLALAAPADAATLSVLPLDGDDRYQDPGNLVIDRLVGGNTIGQQTERDVDINRNNGQSFTITSATIIDKVAINYSNLQAGGTSTTFEFFRVADPNASGPTPDGGIIDSVTFTGADAAFGGNAAGTLIFDVTDTLAAVDDAFAFRFVTASPSTHSIKWEILDNSSSASYDGGTAYENNATFNKVYTFGVVAVPEPAGAALLAVGGGLLLSRRRR